MPYKQRLLAFICIAFISTQSASPAVRYRDIVFTSYQVQNGIQYGTSDTLLLNTYMPTGDTAHLRPLVIFVHGGGFVGGNRAATGYPARVIDTLSRSGYVVASIDYRLTPGIVQDNPSYFEAMLRALQDTKAAIRYFRKNFSIYRVDTSQIFIAGSSAGSITSLHAAYLDSTEVPSYVRWANVGNSFEGNRGNPGFSSRVAGVISGWGAIGDTAWIRPGDVPVYCIHGLADTTIYYDSIPAYHCFLYSSKYIYKTATQKKIKAGLLTFANTGHTLDNDVVKQDSAIKNFTAWLYTILKEPATAVWAPMSRHDAVSERAAKVVNPLNGTVGSGEHVMEINASAGRFDLRGKSMR
jgi:hypothetical protein